MMELKKSPNIDKIESPYNIWIIDNFLKKKYLDLIIKEWPHRDHSSWHKGHETINGKPNILEQGMRGISKLENMPPVISEIIHFFHTQEFTDYIGKLLDISGLVSDSHMRWSGMRTMLPGSFQLIHSDARISPESRLRKELTCMLYLNDNYDRIRDEGCLEIWDDAMSGKIYEIEPILNRMVIFMNSDKSFHGVPNVKSERRAITFSIMKSGETSERSKALFVARPGDSEEIEREGINRSKVGDAEKN